ncbi:hypothetical protein D5E85_27875 [Vibrio parahaemolyticus]|nr:hypothetical protein D5E85_27875 [Vibrio parahaemolyticus]
MKSWLSYQQPNNTHQLTQHTHKAHSKPKTAANFCILSSITHNAALSGEQRKPPNLNHCTLNT